MSRTPTRGIDYTSKDYESFRNDMLNQIGIKMPEYTDLRQSDAGVVLLELLAQGLDILSYYQDCIANEAFLVTAEQRNNALKWCQMLSYTPRSATPARFKQVFVLAGVQTKDTIIPAGTILKTLETAAEPQVKFETETDLTIPAGKYGDEKDTSGNYLYTVSVVEGSPVRSELLGTSTGAPSQKYTLNYSPAILDSVTVTINEGSGFEKWTRVSSFVDSSPTSKHFVVTLNDNDEATVTFGNGVFGKIPKAFANGIYSSYRVGGGENGNVGAEKIKIVETSELAIIGNTFNPSTAYEEGHNKESLDEIKMNAPLASRALWGALTTEDFEGVVKLNFPGILFCRAIPNSSKPTDISLYCVTKTGAALRDIDKTEILNIFDANEGGRKIVGATTVTVADAAKVSLAIPLSLVVKPRYSAVEVKTQIETFLRAYFELGNFDIGEDTNPSRVISDIMNPDNGIMGIDSLKFTGADSLFTAQPTQYLSFGSVTWGG